MAITSTTLAGIAVWQFSGVVTDADLKTAWSGLVVNNRYKPGRAIYLDSTADISGVRGSFYVDCEAHGIILHSARDKSKTVFNNFELTQTVGLPAANRSQFVRVTDGTTVTNSSTDGIDMKGGAMIYAVVGAPPSGNPRFLNEMIFGSLDGTLVTSAAFTLQEIEPRSIGSIWRRLNLQKVSAFPILEAVGGLQRQVIYSSTVNTEGISLIIRPYYNNSVCLVSCLVRRNGNIVTNNLVNTFGSNGSAVIMILNTWLDETFFGVSKTNFIVSNWSAGNRVIGGVLKKLKVLPSTIIKVYDSRSTTTPAKSTFSETTQDYLTGTTFTTADATTGNASIVHVGGIATGSGAPITRYTNQRFTLQLFGYKVEVKTPDMTFGDDDLSAFSPITMTVQDGLARTQAAINAATVLTSFQDLLEELHVLAIGLSGSASYAGAFGGNLFTFSGGKLTTAFTTVNVDATAASKIAYNSAINTLTIKASTLTSNDVVTEWINSGAVNLLNSAKITGIYGASGVRSTNYELRNVKPGAAYIIANNSTKATILYGVNNEATAQTYTVQFPPGSAGTQIYVARKAIGDFFDFEVVTLEEGLVWTSLLDIPDEGAKETNEAALNAYTALETNTKLYNYMTGIYMRTEAGMKLGNFFLREGKLLKWAAPYSALVKKDAAGLIVKSGNVFQIKTNVLNGDENYDTHILVPPATMTADTDEIITTNVEDANGNSSVTIAGGDNLGYKLWKVPASLPADGDETTGTLLATVQRNDKFRFIGVPGFDIIGVDNSSGVRRRTSMAKGIYRQTFYVGDEIQLSDEAPQLVENNEKLDVLTLEVNDMQAQIDALQALVNALPQAGDIVDANIVKVNGVTVDGTGSESDPWGPV